MYKELISVLLPYLKPYKRKAIGALLLSLVLAALTGAQVKLVKPIFDHGLSPLTPSHEVWQLALVLFVLGLLNFPARFYHFYWLREIGENMNSDLREKVFRKFQVLPSSFYTQNKQGKMLSYIINDAEIFAQGYRAIVDVVREPAKAIVYLSLAIMSDWKLTLVIFIVAPLFVLIFQKSGKKIRENQNKVQHERGELTHDLSEGLSANKVMKAFNLQEFVSERFKLSQSRYYFFMMKTSKIEELAHPLVELVGAFAFSIVIIFAYYRIQSQAMTVGDFVQFIAALALLMDPIRKFSQANVKVGQGISAYHRLKSILSLEEEIDKGMIEEFHFRQQIEFKNVSFSYDDHQTLKGINFVLNKGEKLAFVGLSGSGKSTLINILLGLYPIQKGEILIDGVKHTDLKLKTMRSLMGLVSQDIFLFNDTIKTNLCLGKNVNDADLEKALRVSYADEFIYKLPQKLETVIGDRGTRLSGGQQQRLTIARAFIQNPDIFLFDEATSALDNESEKVVQQALHDVAGNKTVIAVAHRLSTIAHYDKILVLKAGSIVESGRHEELMNLNGEYKKLYELSLKD